MTYKLTKVKFFFNYLATILLHNPTKSPADFMPEIFLIFYLTLLNPCIRLFVWKLLLCLSFLQL